MAALQDINDQNDLHDRPFRCRHEHHHTTAAIYIAALAMLGMIAFGLTG